MHIELNLSNILEVIAIIISWMCGKVNLNSEKVSKNISICLTMFSICFLVLSCLTFGSLTLADYFIMALLSFFQRYWIVICCYIFFFALVPPAAASWERNAKDVRMEQSYVKGNRFYNLLGAGSACVMFGIAHNIVGDFSYLNEFQIQGIVPILISACVGLVLAYQSIEQHKELPDHDADTKWLNQKLNMLHLFHAFFFSSLSVVSIVCYSIYCYIHNLPLTIKLNYFVCVSLALLFFLFVVTAFSSTCLYGILGYGPCDFSFECILDVMVFDEHGNAVCAMDFYCNTFLDLCMSHFL